MEDDMRNSETGILSDSMTVRECANPSDIGVRTTEGPPMQLPVSLSLIVQSEQSLLIAPIRTCNKQQ